MLAGDCGASLCCARLSVVHLFLLLYFQEMFLIIRETNVLLVTDLSNDKFLTFCKCSLM